MSDWNNKFDAIVIGSGFGGSVAITKMIKKAEKGLEHVECPRILVIERGTWWRNPEGPGLRPHKAKKSSIHGKWQYWARPRDSQGLAYVAESIYKEHNPIWDIFNPTFSDNDLGLKKNRKGMYRLTRFSHALGNVDVISGSAVGGGSLFYSGVNLIPHAKVLKRIGLGHLTSEDFREAGRWMKEFRGPISKINTKIPVPHYRPTDAEIASCPGDYFQLGAIPESEDLIPETSTYEQPSPNWKHRPDEDSLLLDRSRVLKRAMCRVLENGGFTSKDTVGKLSGKFSALPLSVVEYEPPIVDKQGNITSDTRSNEKNTHCTREGSCILGCLPSARHTLYKTIQNTQQLEKGAGIEVIPMTKVSHIDKNGEDFVVRFESFLDGEEGQRDSATAPLVFVAAGTLGTSEILLRTQQEFQNSNGARGLSLSPSIGRGFSTNGDFFAFTYDLPRDHKTRRQVKDDKRIGNANPTVGPINSSHFYLIFGEGSDRVDINVEDAGIPTTFARLLHGLLPHFSNLAKLMNLGKALIRNLLGLDPFGTVGKPDTEAREEDDFLTERELVSDVFFYNLMGAAPNEPLGTFSLQKDGSGLDLSYAKELCSWEVFDKQESVLQRLTEQMSDPGDVEPDGVTPKKAKLMLSPFWQAKEKRVTVVHPLGGATVGSSALTGSVNESGQVFTGGEGNNTEVHKGLYVVDAAAIPGAVGVNPTYTIVTQALRSVDHALKDWTGRSTPK